MTAPSVVLDDDDTAVAPRARAWSAADVTVGAVLLCWLAVLTPGTGGREPRVLTWMAVSVLVATIVVRPWRVLPVSWLVLGHGLGLAAVVVVATAPTGLDGRHDAASYAVVGQLALVVAAWATDHTRRLVLLLALVALGLQQVTQGWLAWWGGEDPTQPFQGTFYWHNQAGIALAIGAVVACGVAAFVERPWRLLGLVAAPLCGAFTVFTTSRASQLALVGGIFAVAAVCLVLRAWGGLIRVLGCAGGAWALSLLLAGPPFFAERVSPLAGTGVRGTAEPLSGNTETRLITWQFAVDVFQRFPVTGTGFHGFKSATSQLTGEPQLFHHSHNGLLQAAADGGVVLALPLWTAVVGLAVLVLRRSWQTRRTPDRVQLVGALALLLLVLHSGMDFDWGYPALFCAAAVIAPVAVGGARLREPLSDAPRRTAAVVGCTLLVLSALAAWHGGLDLNSTVTGLA